MLVAGAGIEPTPRRSERPVLPLDHPALFVSSGHVVHSKSSGRRIRTFTSCFKGRWPAISRSPNNQECPAGVEPASPGWKPGTFAARPRARVSSRRKERESNPQGRQARPLSKRLPSPIGLPFQVSCGGRNRTCVKTVNSRRPVPAQAPPHHVSQDGWK